jgi:nucleotide-binding universal stress UspA family protein
MAGRHVQRIVVGIDFSPMSKQVLRETIHHVGTGGAELHVLFVATSSDVIDQWQLDLKVLIDDVLEHRAKHHTLPPLRIFAHVRSGNPAQALASMAGEVRADLIVVGTHGHRGLDRLLLGSVAEQVVRTAPCRVLVVRQRQAVGNHCMECLRERKRSGGVNFWCDIHAVPARDGRHAARSTLLEFRFATLTPDMLDALEAMDELDSELLQPEPPPPPPRTPGA